MNNPRPQPLPYQQDFSAPERDLFQAALGRTLLLSATPYARRRHHRKPWSLSPAGYSRRVAVPVVQRVVIKVPMASRMSVVPVEVNASPS